MDGGRRGFVADNWWQTELGGPTLGTPLTLEGRPGFVGVPLPGVEAKVVNAEGREVPPGTGGLLALGRPFPHMMRTVWGNHARYTQYWTEIPGNLYAAGDVASRTAEGYFAVPGRRRAQRGRTPHRHRRRGKCPGPAPRGGRGGRDRHTRPHQGREHQGFCGGDDSSD
jgi:acyl-CoA synthetase (AMP-forming)/AMP-acid ligase II